MQYDEYSLGIKTGVSRGNIKSIINVKTNIARVRPGAILKTILNALQSSCL